MLLGIRARAAAATLALLALASGCTKSPTRPPVTEVRLSLAVQPSVGGPSSPISMVVSALNAGGTQLWHCEGCGCGNGVSLTVLAPDGTPVAPSDPRLPQPLCPDGAVPLRPGDVLTNGGRFTGVLYVTDSPTPPSPTYAALPGTYTVVASFGYSMSAGVGWPIGITRVATFVWKP